MNNQQDLKELQRILDKQVEKLSKKLIIAREALEQIVLTAKPWVDDSVASALYRSNIKTAQKALEEING